mgnify:CR=1 FL=1
MRNYNLTKTIILVALITFMGCSKDDGDGGTTPPPPVSNTLEGNYTGTWSSTTPTATFNGVSVSTMTDLLRKMKDNSTFYNSLPIAGVSGTLRNLLKGTHAENNLRAKSGSMERVRSYAGYVTSKSGKKLAFSIILNNYSSTSYQVKKDLEKFMKLVSEL